MTIECAHCTKPFTIVPSRAGRTKYCSLACKAAALQNQIQRTCPTCGVTFSIKACYHLQRYCSHACAYQDRQIQLQPLNGEQQTRIQHYETLVASVARKLHIELTPRTMDYDDFYQEGVIGLITAIQQDNDPHANFAGFAKVHIRSAIIAAYRTQEHAIRLPESLFRHDAQVTDEHLQQYRSLSACVSLDVLPAEGRHTRQQGSTIEDCIIRDETIEKLHTLMLRLPVLQCKMIAEHYGLIGEETAMLQLCQRYNIPRATMHRLVHRGLDTMKKVLEATA